MQGRLFLPLLVSARLCAQVNFPPDLSISRLEVVQTVQDEAQTVPLTAGKATAVRAFIRQQGRPEAIVNGVSAFLRAFRNGVEIAGSPLRPVNLPVAASLNPDRANINHSQNFVLPADWTRAGRIELRAELRLPPGTPEAPTDNNTIRREVDFVAAVASELRVLWMPVCAAAGCDPGSLQHQGLAGRLLPVADGTLRYEDVPAPPLVWPRGVSTLSDSSALLAHLRKWQLLLGLSSLNPHFLVGWITGAPAAPDVAFSSSNSDAAWVAEQQDSNLNQRLLAQVLYSPFLNGICDTAIQDPGFDPVAARLVASGQPSLLGRCADPTSLPWLSATDAKGYQPPNQGPAGNDFLIVSGTVRRDGSGSLAPAYRMEGRSTASVFQETRDACLHVTAADRETPFCFTPVLASPRSTEPIDEASFAQRIPVTGAVTRLRLTRGDQELAVLNATGQTPAVRFLNPQGGETLSGERTVQWSGTDPSNRPLTYALFYAVEDGSWIPLAVDLRESQFTLDVRYLLPGTVRFLVVASAGLDVGRAVSDPVDVPAAPRIQLADTIVDFGSASSGQISERSIVIGNAGQSPLELSSGRISGDTFAWGAPLPIRVRAGGERIVPLRYRPRVPGQEAGEAILASNEPEFPEVTLSLRAAAFDRPVPAPVTRTRLLDFGQVVVGQTRELPIELRNEGIAPLVVSNLSTLNARFAAISPVGPFTVEGGEERVIVVRFTPLGDGAQSGTLNIATNDPASPALRVELRGSGQFVNLPQIEISPTSLDFGGVNVGQLRILAVTARNRGAGPLSLTALTTSNPAFTVVSPVTPAGVAPNSQQVISVRFAPSATGTQTAVLTIESNDPERASITVNLTGSGLQPAPAPLPRITSVTPASVGPVIARFNLTVGGQNFTPASVVQWNGSPRLTAFVNANTIRASLTPEDVSSARNNEVVVVNPPPGGGTSSPYVVLTNAAGAGGRIVDTDLTACPTVSAVFSVFDRIGGPVTALGSANLQCSDDGTALPCTVRSASSVGKGLSIVMVLHWSVAMQDPLKRQRDLNNQRNTALQFGRSIGDLDRIAVTAMDNGVRQLIDFTAGENRDVVKDAVNTREVPFGIGTALYDAIDDGLKRLATQTGRRKAMLIFTGSENTYDSFGPRDLDALFRQVQTSGASLHFVPIGDAFDNTNLLSLLNQFAVDSNGQVLADRTTLQTAQVDRLAAVLTNQHLINFNPPVRDGQPHLFRVNVSVPGATFSAARSYPACRP